ncbi:MAG TPA: hypothetical protein VJ725_11120 [Thermoanaerobaculia bacterium]|nr:hypothetical protein [Thermoanaerobaculia bacterium]
MGPCAKAFVVLGALGMLSVPAPGRAQEDLPAETLAQSTPMFAFRSQGLVPALLLTRSGSAQNQDPRVFLSTRDGWRLIQLPEELHNTSWVWAGRALDGGEIWGITEGMADGRSYLYFVSSTGGRSWRLRGFMPKVSRFAMVETFGMNKSGKGTLILRLDDDPSPDAPRIGHYVYLTKTGGREWAEPMYSAGRPLPPSDVLVPSDQSFSETAPPSAEAWQQILRDYAPPAGE